MAIFQGLLFLLLGLGVLAVDYRSLARGWLPFGPRGLSGRLEFRRDEQPLGYWFAFALYGAGGIALVVFALRLLAGSATPLPLN